MSAPRLLLVLLAVVLIASPAAKASDPLVEMRSAYADTLQVLRQAGKDLEAATQAQQAAEIRLATTETIFKTRHRVRLEQVAKIRQTLQSLTAARFLTAERLRLKTAAVQAVRAALDKLAENPSSDLDKARQERDLQRADEEARAEAAALSESLNSLETQIKALYDELDTTTVGNDFLQADIAAVQRAVTAGLQHDDDVAVARQALNDARQAAVLGQIALIEAIADAPPPLVRGLTLTGPKGAIYKAAWIGETLPVAEDQTACGLPPLRREIAGAEIAPADQERLYREAVKDIAVRLDALTGETAAGRKERNRLDANGQAFQRVAEQNRGRLETAIKRTDNLRRLSRLVGIAFEAGTAAFAIATSGEVPQTGRDAAKAVGQQVAQRLGGRDTPDVGEETDDAELPTDYREALQRLVEDAVTAEAGRLLTQGRTNDSQTLQDQMARFRAAAEDQLRKKAVDDFRQAFRNNKTWRNTREALTVAWTVAVERQVASVRVPSPLPAPKIAESSQGSTDTQVLTFDAIEGVSDRFIRRAALNGYERLAEAAFNRRALQNADKTLARLSVRIERSQASDLQLLSPGSVAGIAASVATAVGASHFGAETNDARDELLQVIIEGVVLRMAIHRLARAGAALATDIDGAEESADELRRRMATAKVGLPLHRRQVEAVDEPLRRFPVEINVSLSLYGLLSVPPDVTIGSQKVDFGENAGPDGRAVWNGTVQLSDPGAAVSRLPITIAGRDLAGLRLDAGSSTRGIAEVDDAGWQFYGPGSETCHAVRVAPAHSLKLRVDDLTVERSIR